jgi:hypothetical protein
MPRRNYELPRSLNSSHNALKTRQTQPGFATPAAIRPGQPGFRHGFVARVVICDSPSLLRLSLWLPNAHRRKFLEVVIAMMNLFRSEFEFQIDARSVEGRYWSKRYSSSVDAIRVAEQLGMQLQPNAQLLLDHGSRMPGYAQGFKDDKCQVTDASLSAVGLEQVASWKPGPTSQIA